MIDDIDPASTVLGYLAELRGIPEARWTEGPIDDLALRLHRLQVLEHVVHEIAAAVELTVIEDMDTDTMLIPGIGNLKRVERSSSTWRGEHAGERLREDLTHAVSTSIAIDNGTGEIDPVKRNIARATMHLALEAIPSFSNLNKAGRDRLGLQIRDYRTYSTTYKVVVETEGDEG